MSQANDTPTSARQSTPIGSSPASSSSVAAAAGIGGAGGALSDSTPLLSVRINSDSQNNNIATNTNKSIASNGSINGGGSNPPSHPPSHASVIDIPTFRLYGVRWYILSLFSLMTLFNNMLAYTFASVHRVSRRYYYGHRDDTVYDPGFGLATLVSCFFITYIIFSFPSSWLIEKYSLKTGVLVGAWLQAIGCGVRVLATPSITVSTAPTYNAATGMYDGPPVAPDETAHGDLGLLLVGQIIISLGQGFFVNPPPLLAALWFGNNERTLATTIAVNANTLGIAVAFILGPAIVSSVVDLPRYVMLCFGLTLFTALCSTIYFPTKPDTPPSHSQTVEPDLPPTRAVSQTTSPATLTPAHAHAHSHSHGGGGGHGHSHGGDHSHSHGGGGGGGGGNADLVARIEEVHFRPSLIEEAAELSSADERDEDDDAASLSEDEDGNSSGDGFRGAASAPGRTERIDVDSSENTRTHGHAHARPQIPAAAAASSGRRDRRDSSRRSRSSTARLSSSGQLLAPPIHGVESDGITPRTRARTLSELAVERSYLSLAEPPCDYVVTEAVAIERQREKDASRLLASWGVFKRMFASSGFIHTLLVFGVAEATINSLSAFMGDVMDAYGWTDARLVGYFVCIFIVMIMVGSAIFGYLIKSVSTYKAVLVGSLIGAACSVFYLIQVGPYGVIHIWFAMGFAGFFIGPIQPLSIESAVEVTYPSPESSVTAAMQVLGNIFSAALFPLIMLCRNPTTHSMTPALYLVFFCLLLTGLFYITFQGTYRRTEQEREKERLHRELHKRIQAERILNQHNQAQAQAQAANAKAAANNAGAK